MDLYLVRHGIAYDPDPAQWPDDKDRPLTPEGEKRFRQVARGLRELVPSVSVVLSSPWARAWRTAELLEKEAHWPAPVWHGLPRARRRLTAAGCRATGVAAHAESAALDRALNALTRLAKLSALTLAVPARTPSMRASATISAMLRGLTEPP